MSVPTIKLDDGQTIPQVGLGLWKVKDQSAFDAAFTAGVAAGYRHFDSAQAYDNEQFLGEAWKTSGLARDDLFLTTKIAVSHFSPKKVQSSFAESLEKLQTEYVDLLLLHFPVTIQRKKAWLELEAIHKSGRAKHIGVSNYTVRHLEEMQKYSSITPAVNQVELHVFLQQPELITYCREQGIVVEAYSPLAHAQAMDNETITKIAKKHNKTYAQVMLRWLIQQDLVVLPKSVTPARIQENIAIFDFKLDEADLAGLQQQDRDLRTCWSPVHVP